MKQPTVRQINEHTFAGTGVCVVYAQGWQMRISRARTRNGVKEGRVVNWHGERGPEGGLHDWHPIPADAVVELR
jgi:hypothetical protein